MKYQKMKAEQKLSNKIQKKNYRVILQCITEAVNEKCR